MKTLARALIQTTAFLEFSSDEVIRPEDAVRALEDIAHALQSASPEELAAVRAVLQELADAERASVARADVLKFYEQFFECVGVTVPIQDGPK